MYKHMRTTERNLQMTAEKKTAQTFSS